MSVGWRGRRSVEISLTVEIDDAQKKTGDGGGKKEGAAQNLFAWFRAGLV